MLEAYQAYSDYNGIADLTQELIQNAAIAVTGSTEVTWVDLTGPAPHLLGAHSIPCGVVTMAEMAVAGLMRSP